MPRHDFTTAVKGAISEQLHDRVGCAFPIYPVQGVRAAGLQLALIFYAGMWNSWYINYTTLQLTQFRCRRCRLDDIKGRSLAKKHLKITRFGTHFGGAYGILPRSGANHSHKPYIDELQILPSLYMPRHNFATAVKGATSEELRDRVGCAFPIYPVQDVRAARLQLVPLIYTGMWNSG